MKRSWVIAVIIFFFTGLGWVVLKAIHKQKEAVAETAQALTHARESIAQARLKHVFVYVPEVFAQSEALYQEAMDQWKAENNRWVFARHYETVVQKADEAAKMAAQAIGQSSKHRDQFQKDFELISAELAVKISVFESFYSFLPLPDKIRRQFVSGRVLYSESQQAGNKGAFRQAYDIAQQSAALINPAHNFGEDKLNDYFSDFSKWKDLNQQALKLSHTRRVIMVDKIARRCFVYRNGKIQNSFKAELGKNWLGTKQYQGDKATPEGQYQVTKKIKGSQTQFYKALMIDYPNEADKERFKTNKANGQLPRNARIGGLIEIHGEGGKGTDWTNGCVALTNGDMDRLFSASSVGTPVFIVGSLVSWDQIKRNDRLINRDED